MRSGFCEDPKRRALTRFLSLNIDLSNNFCCFCAFVVHSNCFCFLNCELGCHADKQAVHTLCKHELVFLPTIYWAARKSEKFMAYDIEAHFCSKVDSHNGNPTVPILRDQCCAISYRVNSTRSRK